MASKQHVEQRAAPCLRAGPPSASWPTTMRGPPAGRTPARATSFAHRGPRRAAHRGPRERELLRERDAAVEARFAAGAVPAEVVEQDRGVLEHVVEVEQGDRQDQVL